ncbi:AGAP008245-PA-like protein [Anopheles sinensis]|uniref:AGAP008245-PA-like protein n=1 Tax=Anopheles sinensis TaxID=74873 RepID=A0A084W4S1_ANOSI|nr:AGAP008245-PA-like protein [Anopheles sinensis]
MYACLSNSKASYLPRQPRDKLHSDPDHGSYKLTLTSNEDCINHGSNTTGGSASSGGSGDVFPEEIITSPKCNLPDVLPAGVKYSLYSNNNNNNTSMNNNNNNNINNHHNGHNGKMKHGAGPHSAPIIATANSLKSLFNFNSSSQTSVASSDPSKESTVASPPSTLYNGNSSPPLAQIQATSPKYTSQSSFDLKKTQILESLNGSSTEGGQCNGYHLYNGSTGHTGTGGILGLPTTTNSGATATLTSIASINATTDVEAEEPQHTAADDGIPPPLPSTPLPVLNGTSAGHLWPAAPTVNNCNENPEKSANFEPHQQWNGLVADHQHQHHHYQQHHHLQQHHANTVVSASAPTAASTVGPSVEGSVTPLPTAPDCSTQHVSEVSSVGSVAHDDAPALSSVDAAPTNNTATNTTTTTTGATVTGVAKEEGEGESRSTKSTSSSSTSPETTGPGVVVNNGLASRDNNHVGTGDSPPSYSVPAVERVTKEINFTATSLPVDHTEAGGKSVAQVQQLLQRTEIVLRVQAPTSEAASQTENDDGGLLQPNALGLALAELTIIPATAGTHAGPESTVRISSISHGTQSATATVATSTSSSPLPGSSPTPGSPGKENRFFNGSPPLPQTPPPRKLHPEEIDCDKLSHDLVSQLSPSDKLHTILAPKTFKSSSDYVSDLFNIQIAPRPLKKDASTATPTEGGGPQKSREMTLINGDCCDLTKKKEELVQRLGKKLLVLTNEQTSIAEESNANDLLGNDVALKVTQKVRPTDASKFRSYVDDVGYITMLLLSLSGRLARTDNALHSIDSNHPDKKILEAKRERLLEQLDEAKQLKDDIDRRGAIIARILEQALTIEEYADYDYFINMKAKLIVDSREIADKIKLGEEQLAALKDTLVQSEC